MNRDLLTQILLDQSKDLFWMIDLDFKLIFANKTYFNLMKEVTGVEKKLNESVLVEGLGEGYIEKWKAYYNRALSGNHFDIEEHFYNPESNEIQYSQITFEPVTDNDQNYVAVACQSKDITTMVKHRTESNQLINASIDVFCTINKLGHFVYVSAASAKHWGYLPEEVVGKSYMELILEEDVPKTNEMAADVFNGREIKTFANRYRKKNGDIAYNFWSARFDADTKLIYAVARDGKEKIEQDEKILQSEQRFKALVQEGSDLIAIIDIEGNYKYVSPTCTSILGMEPQEFIGRNAAEFIHPQDAERAYAFLQKVTTENRVVLQAVRFQNYKKEWRWMETVFTNMLHNPVVNGIVVNSRDITDKIEQEEKNLQSEQRFKALVQEGSDLIGIIDAEGNYKYVSPTSISVLEIAPEEFIGRNAFEFIHTDDVERTLASLQKITTENRVLVEPFRFQNSQKEWRWIETVLTNMLDNPAVKGIVANSRDITDKVNAIQQIEANDLFNRTVLECSPDCLKVLDIEGRIHYMNFNGLCQMEIDDFSTVKDKNWFTLWGTKNEALVKASLDKAVAGETAQFTAFCPTQKGTPKWWDVMVSPVSKPGESVQQIIAVSRDITEQKKEEQRLKLLESVITNTKDAVLITEAEPFDEPGNKIIYVNKAFTEMTGYSAEEVIGKSPRFLQGPNSNRKELERLGFKMRNWESCELTTINYKKNGEEFWINFKLTPVADEKGWFTHWISIERDVTGQKINELENELLAKINTSFNAENDYLDAANAVCKSISKYGNFDLVEVWTANLEKSQMQLFGHYFAAPEDQIFYKHSQEVDSFKMSESLVGKVWTQQEQMLWDDIENRNDFVRRDAAKKIGLKAVLGIPLIFNNEAVGVLKIGTKQDAVYLKKYTQLFKRLETFIGSEFNRKKLENDLSHLFDAIPDIICLLDFDGRYLKINKTGCELLGSREEDILYHKCEEFVHPDDKGIFMNGLMQLKQEETNFKFENRYITKDGEIIWLSWYCNTSQEDRLIYATAKNITEEKKLRELNRLAGSMSKIGSWEVDLIKQRIFWSDEVHQLHETDSKSFVPNLETAINFYREDYRGLVQSYVKNCITTGLPFDFEAVLVTANNKERWVRAIGNAEFADGKCSRFFGSFQDINDRKESENRLISLSENLPGIVIQYLIYPDGTDAMQYISGNVEQLWGFTASEVKENTNLVWDQIRAGGDYEKLKENMLKSIQTKSKFINRYRYIMPTGELRTHLTIGSPIFLADSTVLFNSIVLDITAEVKKEELLVQASKMSRIGSWEMDLINKEGKSMYWSPMVREILEVDDTYNASYASGLELHKGESKERIKKAFKILIKNGVEFDEELLIHTINGKELWVRCIGKSEKANNKLIRIYGSLQDIDERKKSEIKLAESENKFRTILEAEPECIKLLDSGGVVMMMNPAGLAMIEADNEEQVLGKSVLGIVLPEHRSKFSRLTKNVFKGEFGKLEFEIEGLKGTHRWLETHAVPLKNEEGEIISLLGVTRDITERKKAEEKLVDSEQKYRLIALQLQLQQVHLTNAQQVAKVGSWETDLHNLKVAWSDETYRIFGTDRESFEPTHEKFLKLVHPLDRDKVDKAFAYSIEATIRSQNVIEHRIVTHSGEVKVVEERWKITYDDNDKPLLAIGICQDITERKKAEEDVKDSEEKRRLIMNGALDAIICIDISGNITFWNHQAEVIFGWKETEVMGQQLSELIVPEPFRKYHNEGMKHYLETGEGKALNVLLELSAIRRSGEEFPIELTIIPIKQGVEEFFCAFIRDITQRKKAAQSILQSNERFEKVTEATNDVIWDWDLVNQTFYRSRAIERFFRKKESKSFTFEDFWKENFHQEDLAKIKQSITLAIENPTTTRWELEYRVLNEQGNIFYIKDRGVIIRNNEGKAIRVVGAMTDISEQKNMTVQLSELNQSLQQHSEELERSNEELEQFAFVASHDLQEPLRMISSFMDQLKRKYGHLLDPKAHQYIHFATDGAKSMKQIILDLLDYSRATRPTEGKEEVNLNRVLSEFKQLRRKLISEKHAKIISKNLPTLNTYKAAITQIFNCMLDNAIKYSLKDTPPKVEINVVEMEKEWEFSIKDNGIGIESQFYDKIFIIFQRLHNKNQSDGTGIGLSIAKRHVEFLGGRIWLNSQQGKGTIFYFTIPKSKQYE